MNRTLALKFLIAVLFAAGLVYSQGCRRHGSHTVLPSAGAPTITTQPTSQASTVGLTATFTVVASGSGNSYQWKKGGVAIGGATSSTYTTPVLVIGDNGSTFSVTVTNGNGSVTSNTVTLTVNVAGFPTITTQPSNQSVVQPATATFSVTVSGAAVLNYQWYRGAGTGSPVGTNSNTYTTAATTVASDNGATFHVVTTNGVGSVDSNLVTLTVTLPGAPTITTQPTNMTVTEPATATFTVAASGAGLSYQWYQGAGTGTPVGTNSNSYTTPATVAATDNGSKFHVVVTNAGGSVDSTLVTLTVNVLPTGNPLTGVPSTLTLSGATGGNPVSKTFKVTNSYGTPVTVTLTDPAAWLTSWPATFTLAGGASQWITVTGDPVSAGGTQTATLTLTNSPGSLTKTVSVTINVAAATGTASISPAVQDAMIGTLVSLNGSASTGGFYAWTQIAGTPVTLNTPALSSTTFTAPAAVPAETLVFQLAASSSLAGVPAIAIASVTVYEDTTRVIYVDTVAGADTNTFTGAMNSKSAPMKTLEAAVIDSDNNSGGGTRPDIVMTGGTYNIAPASANGIQLYMDISIYGGFKNTAGVWTRDVSANATNVVDTRTVPASGVVAALDASNQNLAAVVYDGFSISAPGGDYSDCVLTNRTATWRRVTFLGGTASAGDSECVRIQSNASVPVFDNCTFTLGTASAGSSIGIYLQPIGGSTSSATVTNCTFGGGSATGSVTDILRSNDTVGAPAMAITGCNFLGTGPGGTGSCSAIFLTRSSATITGCNITPPTSTAWSVGVFVYNRDSGATNNTSATCTIDKCVIDGGTGASSSIGIWYTAGPVFTNAVITNPLIVTNSYLSGGNSAAENVAINAEMFTGSTALAPTATLQAKVTNCTIDAGYNATAAVTGIQFNGQLSTAGCKLTIDNNILFTRKTALTGSVKLIAENVTGSTDAPATLRNNLFFIDNAYAATGAFPAYYYLRPTGVGPTPTFSMPMTAANEIDAAITSPIGTKSGNINLTVAQGIANSTVFFSTAPFNYHLTSTSNPAIDAGLNASAPADDIDGNVRPNGSTVDIGADEN